MTNDSANWLLIGHLADDAPGLYRDLRRTFDSRAMQFISRCYRESAVWGGLREYPVLRETGVAFTPRPARILKILLKEAPPVSVQGAGAALLCTIPSPYLQFTRGELLPAIEIATEVSGLQPRSTTAQFVVLAQALDEARHLHMTELGEQVRVQRYQLLASLFSTWQREFGERIQCKRLLELLHHWLEHRRDTYSSTAP